MTQFGAAQWTSGQAARSPARGHVLLPAHDTGDAPKGGRLPIRLLCLGRVVLHHIARHDTPRIRRRAHPMIAVG